MIPYLIHVSILTAVLFLAYRILLSRETFFVANRYLLLSGIAASFIIPLISIPSYWSIHDAELLEVAVEEPIPVNTDIAYTLHAQEDILPLIEEETGTIVHAQPSELVTQYEQMNPGADVHESAAITSFQWNAVDILRTIYSTGLGVFCFLFLMQLMRLAWMYHKGVKRKEAGLHIVENDSNESSFSFWSCVFLNKDAYDADTYRQILDHERIHIESRHSLDMLIAEIFVIVQWYNPLAWMYKKAIENNLEYLTDQKMLSAGADRQSYQLSLVRVAVPQRQIALSNYYNQSSLKKRIIMMNHKKSSKTRSWKYLLILPFIALSMIVLNGVRAEAQPPDVETTQLTDPIDEFHSQLASISDNNTSGENSSNNEPKHSRILKASVPSLQSKRAKESDRVLPVKRQTVYTNDSFDTIRPPVPPRAPAPISGDMVPPPPPPPMAPMKATLASPPTPPSAPAAPRPVLAPAPHAAHAPNARPVLAAIPAPPAPPAMRAMLAPPAPPAPLAPLAPVIHPFMVVDMKSGNWEAKIKGDQTCITFSKKDNDGKWTWRSCDDGDFLKGIEKVAKGPYRFEREAGTLILTGEWSGRKGKGTFEFEGSQSFQNNVKAKGGTAFSDGALFQCFMNDLGKDYINMLAENGVEINGDAVQVLAAHGINEPELREYSNAFKKAGLKISNAEDIAAFHIHGIDGEYIADMYQYLGDINVQDYVQMGIHGVEPEFAGEAHKVLGGSLHTDELVQMAIHGIDVGYIREMKEAGLTDLSTEQIVQYAVHGVQPEYIAALKQSGISDLSHEAIIQAGLHGVDADYVQDLINAGIKDLDIESVVQMSIHGVEPELAEAINKYDFRDKSLETIVQASIHGMDADNIKEIMDLGWDDPDIAYLIQAHIHGIDADDLREARGAAKKGNDLESVMEYILQNGMRE